MTHKHVPVFILLAACVFGTSCNHTSDKKVSSIFHVNQHEEEAETYDLDNLLEQGELIAVTLSGPDTYFEFRGQGFGLQYDLISDFALRQGLRVRMEIAHDTTEMYQMLSKGEVDVIALPVPPTEGFIQCALQDTTGAAPKGWVTRETSVTLAQALNSWYHPSLAKEIAEQKRLKQLAKYKRPSEHHPRPKMKNQSEGIISDYDALFRQNSSVCNWDWRLLAAQCYQESAFDPSAVSFAGAQGLMQLMPSTARSLGVQESEVYNPAININAAARLIHKLNGQLANIENLDERINFILASYNGGLGHVKDAMALTKKYGGNSQLWKDVEVYILKLEQSEYYRDPVVKYGYLRGTETAGYVRKIRSHWDYYRNNVR